MWRCSCVALVAGFNYHDRSGVHIDRRDRPHSRCRTHRTGTLRLRPLRLRVLGHAGPRPHRGPCKRVRQDGAALRCPPTRERAVPDRRNLVATLTMQRNPLHSDSLQSWSCAPPRILPGSSGIRVDHQVTSRWYAASRAYIGSLRRTRHSDASRRAWSACPTEVDLALTNPQQGPPRRGAARSTHGCHKTNRYIPSNASSDSTTHVGPSTPIASASSFGSSRTTCSQCSPGT